MIRLPRAHQNFCLCLDCHVIKLAEGMVNSCYEAGEFSRFPKSKQDRIVRNAVNGAIRAEELRSQLLESGDTDKIYTTGNGLFR